MTTTRSANPCRVCGEELIGTELAFGTCGHCGRRFITPAGRHAIPFELELRNLATDAAAELRRRILAERPTSYPGFKALA